MEWNRGLSWAQVLDIPTGRRVLEGSGTLWSGGRRVASQKWWLWRGDVFRPEAFLHLFRPAALFYLYHAGRRPSRGPLAVWGGSGLFYLPSGEFPVQVWSARRQTGTYNKNLGLRPSSGRRPFGGAGGLLGGAPRFPPSEERPWSGASPHSARPFISQHNSIPIQVWRRAEKRGEKMSRCESYPTSSGRR